MTTSRPFNALESAYQLHFYLLFKTRYLRPLLAGRREQDLIETVIDDVFAREQYHLLDTSITPNYLRLLVSLKPEQTISHVVKTVKGNLSFQFGFDLKEQLLQHNAKTLFARGYFARSSGKVNLETARRYVEIQAEHHGYKGSWTKPLSGRNPAFKSPAFKLAHCLCMLDYHVVLATQSRNSLFDEYPAMDGKVLLGRLEANRRLECMATLLLCRYGWRIFNGTDAPILKCELSQFVRLKLKLHTAEAGGVRGC